MFSNVLNTIKLNSSKLLFHKNYRLLNINEKVSKLLSSAAELSPNDETKDENCDKKFSPKTAKGMRDFEPQEMAVRERVFTTIKNCFERHGALQMDTPVCELTETLTGKYGEESPLIFDLVEQGGHLLSLRYDLTVPFARYLAQNKIISMKRYQIGKVYRRDTPSLSKGRFREFYQADFDISGHFDAMIPEVECLRVIHEILEELRIGSFLIKVNHRQVLDGLFEICGVPSDKFKTICSAIDKLDRFSWSEVKNEMCLQKGLPESVADKIGEFVRLNGSVEVIDWLLKQEMGANNRSKEGLESLKLLLKYCDIFKLNEIRFDMSLARGLNYYTGIIYEAVPTSQDIQCGSVAAGGRYDNLVGMLSNTDNWSVPCVGLSIGIERILAIIENKLKDEVSYYPTQIFIASIGKNMTEERMKLIVELWESNIRAEHSFNHFERILTQFQYCEKRGIPFAIILGEDELKKDIIKIRNINTREEEVFPRQQLIQQIKRLLNS